MSDRLSGTDEGAKTKFTATEALIENFCRPLSVAAGERDVKPVEFFPSGQSESPTCRATIGFDDDPTGIPVIYRLKVTSALQ